MNRRTSARSLALTLAVLIGWLGNAPVYALAPRTLLSSTTLNGAISSTATTLILTSASASSGSSFGAPAAGQCLYIDLEMMRIVSTSSTTMTVTRGTNGRGPHATLAVVLTGPCGMFHKNPPLDVGGNQTCTSMDLPWIDTNTGDDWWCDLVSNLWSVTNPVTRNGTAGSRRVAQ